VPAEAVSKGPINTTVSPVTLRVRRHRSLTQVRRFDGRTPEAARIRMLEALFLEQLGIAAGAKINPILQLSIKRAAELTQISEARRAQAIRGEAVETVELVRLENAATKAMKVLGLIEHDAHGRRPKLVTEKPAPQSLEAYRAEVAAEAEAEEAAGTPARSYSSPTSKASQRQRQAWQTAF
jgi:hypothetical protein